MEKIKLAAVVTMLSPSSGAALVEECESPAGAAISLIGAADEREAVLTAVRDVEIDGRAIHVNGRLLSPIQAKQFARTLGCRTTADLCKAVDHDFIGALIRWEEHAARQTKPAITESGEAPAAKKPAKPRKKKPRRS